MQGHSRLQDGLAFLGGGLLTLSFAPFQLFPLAILAPALLLYLCWLSTPKYALWRGFLFGLGFFGTGVYWVYISVHTYGNASFFFSGGVTALFIMTLSLFPALSGYILKRFFNTQQGMWAFAPLWTLTEALRSTLFSGFPWLLLGYSQVSGPLKNFIPIVGVLGTGFLVVLSSTLLVTLLQRRSLRAKIINAFLFGLIMLIGYILAPIQWTHPKGQALTASLIQGNIPQHDKWKPEHARAILDSYKNLTEQHWDSQFIIWPESAIPMNQKEADPFLDSLHDDAKQKGSTVLAGITIEHHFYYYNAMIMLGRHHGIYLKRHLVPFGEYVPMPSLLEWLSYFVKIPLSGLSAGPLEQHSLSSHGIVLAPFICYEIAYARLLMNHLPNANVLLIITDDSWFGRSIAAAQHAQIARARALESGRYALLVSNTGITSIINDKGQFISRLPAFKQAVLTGTFQPMAGHTPWACWGNTPIVVFMVIYLFVLWRKRRTPPTLNRIVDADRYGR